MLRMKTGKISGVIRSVCSSVPAGRSPVISATRFCTICSATIMSVERIELGGDFRRTADALRADAPHARDGHDDLFDRPGHDERHRLRRKRSGVRNDDDAGKLQRRVDGARQREGGKTAADHQRHRHERDGTGMS